MILKLSLAANDFWYAKSYLYSKFGFSIKAYSIKVCPYVDHKYTKKDEIQQHNFSRISGQKYASQFY